MIFDMSKRFCDVIAKDKNFVIYVLDLVSYDKFFAKLEFSNENMGLI